MPQEHEITKEFAGQPGGQGPGHYAEHDPYTRAKRVVPVPFAPKISGAPQRSTAVTLTVTATASRMEIVPGKLHRFMSTVNVHVVLYHSDVVIGSDAQVIDNTGTLFAAGQEFYVTMPQESVINRIGFVRESTDGKINMTIMGA